MEGTKVDVQLSGERKHPYAETVEIDTSKILFIVGGAFPGIEDIIKKRLKYKSVASVGINLNKKEEKLAKQAEYNEVITQVTTEDFRQYGLIPEFLGRLPVTVSLEDLDEEALIRIIKEPKNALLKQYKYLLELDDVELEFEEEAIKAIAQKAIKRNTGARGLRARLEKVLLEPMFTCQKKSKNKTVNITSEYIKKVEGKNIKIAV